MKSFLLSFIFLLSLAFQSTPVFAQQTCTYTLTGRVVTASGEVAVGASVLLVGTNTGQQADLQGRFSFSGLCAGHHVIQIKLLGYSDQSVRVTLPQSTAVVVTLASDDKVLEEIVVQEHVSHTETANNFQSLEGRALDETRGKSLGGDVAICGWREYYTNRAVYIQAGDQWLT